MKALVRLINCICLMLIVLVLWVPDLRIEPEYYEVPLGIRADETPEWSA